MIKVAPETDKIIKTALSCKIKFMYESILKPILWKPKVLYKYNAKYINIFLFLNLYKNCMIPLFKK